LGSYFINLFSVNLVYSLKTMFLSLNNAVHAIPVCLKVM